MERYFGKKSMGRKISINDAQQAELRRLYERGGMTLAAIAEEIGSTYKVVQRFVAENYSKEERLSKKSDNYALSKIGVRNPMYMKYGAEHHNFKGALSDCKGYWIILKPEWYTGRKLSKHIFLHHAIFCDNSGITEIPEGYDVHHCDLNKSNNSFENLVMLTKSEHQTLHKILKGATTISKESTLKWAEARRNGIDLPLMI